MKFITEYELKFRYQQNPFDTFTQTPDMRLTPEARQFLADHQVKLAPAVVKKASAAAPLPAANKPQLLANYVQLDLYDTARLCQGLDAKMSQKLYATADDLHDQCLQANDDALPASNLVAPDTFHLTYLSALGKFGPVLVRLARLGNELLLFRDVLAPQINAVIDLILHTLAKLIDQLKHQNETQG